MKKKYDIWRFLRGLCAVLIYGVMAFTNLEYVPFNVLNIDINTLPTWVLLVYSTVYQLIMLLLIVILFRKRLKRDFIDLKKNHRKYFNEYLKYWFLVLFLMCMSNALIQVIMPDSIAGNEEAIRELFDISPIYIFIASVLIAPFLEELVFRLGIRYMFKNDKLFITISGLVFGLLHVIGNVEVPLDYLYIIPYSVPGFVFAYVLTKSDNIFTTMGLHFLHNGILLSIEFFIYFFG